MRTVRDRYFSDVAFKSLVDMMTASIMQCGYTASEMREAALLASIKSEEMNIHRYYIVSEDCERALGILHKFVCEEKEHK